MLSIFRYSILLALTLSIVACESELDPKMFQRRAEKIFTEVNPGFGIIKRKGMTTIFVRGDQFFELELASEYVTYESKGKKTSDFLEDFRARLQKEAEARKQTLASAKERLLPFIKSGSWVDAQDLGAIGPARVRDKIRPWRKKIAEDVYVLLGIPEELLGYRYASIQEMNDSKKDAEFWLETGVRNLVQRVKTSTPTPLESSDGKLMVLDYSAVEHVGAFFLDRQTRKDWLSRFNLTELGVSVPNRDVLIVFDPSDFVTVKPIRFRTHQLYDNRNHPGFRGLISIDEDTISMMEPAYPKKKKLKKPE